MKWPIVSRKLHDEKEWSSTINCNEYNSECKQAHEPS